MLISPSRTVPGPRSAAPCVALRRGLLAAALAAAVLTSAPAPALGLGEISQQSALGQALRLVVPITVAPGEELSGECVRLVARDRDGDGIPQVQDARVSLETTGTRPRLVITSVRGVYEPVIRVTVQAGCDAPVRREYTLLMDPLPIEAPTVAAESAGPAATVAAPASAAAGEGAPAAVPTAVPSAVPSAVPGAAGKPRGAARAAAPPAAKAARPPAKARPKATRKGAPSGTAAVRPPTPAPAPDKARLKVSRAAPAGGSPRGPDEDASATALQSQQDLANALEAETVVLRQRVAELSQAIDRMQREMTATQAAAQAAQAARVAAEEAAKASPWATALRWWEGNWPFLAALVGIASLLATGLLYRRRRAAAGDWPMGTLPDDRFEATYMGTAVPGAPAVAGPQGAEVDTAAGAMANAAAAKPASAAHDTGRRIGDVAVSELSQVTEEARVFLELGHADRAIEVLRDHIAQPRRSMPAAWLMLLDLYRTHGREQEFRKLAEDFHLQFNAQTPQWTDLPATDDVNAGLEGFPHIVRELTATWGTPACRDFLERLLYDNRKGRRMGFSFAAFNEILALRQLLDLVLADVDSDAAEERKLRAAWAAATGRPEPAPAPGAAAGAKPAAERRPVNLDLELDLTDAIKSPGRADPKPKP
jgi:hypothetical protein